MKSFLAALLLFVSTSLLADRPECSLTPGACRGGIPSGKIATVPEPGTLALIGMGAAGFIVVRRRKK